MPRKKKRARSPAPTASGAPVLPAANGQPPAKRQFSVPRHYAWDATPIPPNATPEMEEAVLLTCGRMRMLQLKAPSKDWRRQVVNRQREKQKKQEKAKAKAKERTGAPRPMTVNKRKKMRRAGRRRRKVEEVVKSGAPDGKPFGQHTMPAVIVHMIARFSAGFYRARWSKERQGSRIKLGAKRRVLHVVKVKRPGWPVRTQIRKDRRRRSELAKKMHEDRRMGRKDRTGGLLMGPFDPDKPADLAFPIPRLPPLKVLNQIILAENALASRARTCLTFEFSTSNRHVKKHKLVGTLVGVAPKRAFLDNDTHGFEQVLGVRDPVTVLDLRDRRAYFGAEGARKSTVKYLKGVTVKSTVSVLVDLVANMAVFYVQARDAKPDWAKPLAVVPLPADEETWYPCVIVGRNGPSIALKSEALPPRA